MPDYTEYPHQYVGISQPIDQAEAKLMDNYDLSECIRTDNGIVIENWTYALTDATAAVLEATLTKEQE